MSFSRASTEGDDRRRRARYRAWRRGVREVDLLLGGFADAYIERLGESDLVAFEALLGAPDDEVLAWLLGQRQVPPEHDTELLRAIRRFHAARYDR